MNKYLVVGDYHAVPQELPECERLMSWILDLGSKADWAGIIFLGDQYHSFANINAYVMDFWNRSYSALITKYPHVISLVGNHDQPGDNTDVIKIHSLIPHKSQCTVIDAPTIHDRILFMPYYHKQETWLKHYLAQPKEAFDTIIGHQTFMGAKYENGFYAKDGFQTDLIAQSNIISGHLHTNHRVNGKTNIIYPGSPRWRSVSDSNVDKSLHVLGIGKSDEIQLHNHLDGSPLNTDQNGICSKMRHYELHEPQNPDTFDRGIINPNDRIVVDIHGSSKYIKSVVTKIPWADKIRTFTTSTKKITVFEQKGIDESLKDFLSKIETPNGTPAPTLLDNIQKRIQNAGK